MPSLIEKMIKAIVFDLDGTLVDTLKDLAVTSNEILKEYGYQEIEIDQYRYFIGNGIKKLVERALNYDLGDIDQFLSLDTHILLIFH